MDSTAVSGTVGLGSIPSGCIYEVEILNFYQSIIKGPLRDWGQVVLLVP